tara:strand:+ start:806 stop:1207 length:402 start_codon:yes stop_codon:yes gene_type:complete
MAENLRNSSEEHQEFNQVVSEYFEQPGAVEQNFNVPTGKDGEALSPKGRQLQQIFEEERLWKKDNRWRTQNKLQDNLSNVLDIQDEEEDAEYTYNTLLKVVENISTYHNEAGKKAERLLDILKDPTVINKSVE